MDLRHACILGQSYTQSVAAPLVILGIDPGYDRCGFAVLLAQLRPQRYRLHASGSIVTSRSDEMPRRLQQIGLEIEELLARFRPDCAAVEQIYFAKNAKTAIAVAQARGVIVERLAAASVTVAEYAPAEIKSQISGSGKADKAQVEFMVRRLVELPGDNRKRLDDELDAIAIAICHSMRLSIPGALLPAGRKVLA
jgi:crossover junction endodeoxyribonuclease RuvC